MLTHTLRYLWAAPCTAVGLLVAALVVLAGGSLRNRSGVLEACIETGEPAAAHRFQAITLGHVIIGRSEQELRRLHAHELVHVRQYEQWGVLFFLAYPLAGFWQLLSGKRPYWDNYFEVQARARSADDRCVPDDDTRGP